MKVKFVPINKELEIEPGQSVMDLAHKNGIAISSVCNGMPSCAECRVKLVDGEYNVMPPAAKELSLIGTGYYIDQRRLSCQLMCFGDVTVDISEQIEKASEGPVTSKFLARAQKEKPEDSFALGGVLIEQEQEMVAASVGGSAEDIVGEVGGGRSAASSSGGSHDFYQDFFSEATSKTSLKTSGDTNQNRPTNGSGRKSRRNRKNRRRR